MGAGSSATTSFVKNIFCEADGSPSFGRVGSFISLIAVIGWVTHVVLATHAVPSLDGPGMFISAPYGINKVTTMLGNFSGSANASQIKGS